MKFMEVPAAHLPHSPPHWQAVPAIGVFARSFASSLGAPEMRKHLSSVLCATTLLIAGAGMVALPQHVAAQVGTRIGFEFFRHRLEPDGHWFHHPIWGDVWKPGPRVAGPDFQPYTNGYWEYTDDYGWYWVSNDALHDVVDHSG